MSKENRTFDKQEAFKHCVHYRADKPDEVLLNDDLIAQALDPENSSVFCTSQGSILVSTGRFIAPKGDDPTIYKESGVQAYAGMSFITLDIEDAQALSEMILDMARKLAPDEEDPVDHLYSFKSVSYGRLLDRINGYVYPGEYILTNRKHAHENEIGGLE